MKNRKLTAFAPELYFAALEVSQLCFGYAKTASPIHAIAFMGDFFKLF